MTASVGRNHHPEEKREQFKKDALAAWSHYQETGLHVTASEADAWLAKLESGKTAAPPNATTEADLGP
jgi:predicted transcriptional regulator